MIINCPKCGTVINTYMCSKCHTIMIPKNWVKPIEKEYGFVKTNEPITSDVYFLGKKLCEREAPIQVGAAKFCEAFMLGTKGTLLLTNKSLFFLVRGVEPQVYQIMLSNVIKASYNGTNLGLSGNISVATKQNEYKFIVFHGHRWIENIHKAIENLEKEEPVKSISKKEGSSTNSDASYINELKNLKQLVDSGIITDEEFEAKKKQLLGI